MVKLTSPEENIAALSDIVSLGVKYAEKHRKEAQAALKNARLGIRTAREHLAGRRARDTRKKWNALLRASQADASAARAKSRKNNGPVLAGGRGALLDQGAEAIGAVATFAGQLDASTAVTFEGKLVDGALAATGDVLLGKTPVAAVDAVATLAWQAAGIDPKGLTVGDNVNCGIRALVTSAEAGLTGDYRGVVDYDEKARSGQMGPPAQIISTFAYDAGTRGLGETLKDNVGYWYQHGVSGTFSNVYYLFKD